MGTKVPEPAPPKQIACLSKAAIIAGDPETCLRAEHPSVRWPCVALFADQADDPSLCRILPADEEVPASVSQDPCAATTGSGALAKPYPGRSTR